MGEKATELLITQIEKPKKTLSFQSIMLQSEIIPRESTQALSKTIS
jgi:DNA-binding LacI/PurR family transcriptional regulator